MSLLSNNQDLRKLTFKTPYVGANGIRPHAHVVPVCKSCLYQTHVIIIRDILRTYAVPSYIVHF